jgi:hypothetical protein
VDRAGEAGEANRLDVGVEGSAMLAEIDKDRLRATRVFERENSGFSDEGDSVAVRDPSAALPVTVAVASGSTLEDSDKVAERHGNKTFCDVAIVDEPLVASDCNWTAPKAALQEGGVE